MINVPDANPVIFRYGGRCRYNETTECKRRSYINHTRFVFTQLKKVLDAIKAKSDYEKSMIILMSDHGTGFTGPGAGRKNDTYLRSKQDFLEAQMMNASNLLVIKKPFQKKADIDYKHIRVHDVGATIMDALNVKVHWNVTGQSALVTDWKEPELPLPFVQTIQKSEGKEAKEFLIPSPSKYFPTFVDRRDSKVSVKSKIIWDV